MGLLPSPCAPSPRSQDAALCAMLQDDAHDPFVLLAAKWRKKAESTVRCLSLQYRCRPTAVPAWAASLLRALRPLLVLLTRASVVVAATNLCTPNVHTRCLARLPCVPAPGPHVPAPRPARLQVTPADRENTKRLVYALLYGMGV